MNLDQVTASCAAAIPLLQPILQAAPPSDFRVGGQKISRQPHRYSGRTAMLADISVHEPKPPEDPDAPLSRARRPTRRVAGRRRPQSLRTAC